MALPVPLTERTSQGSSVLVVDDEATSRALVEYILEASGHRVTAVDSAVAAAAAIDRHTPDVIVIDFEMPDMDGVELTRAIRADPRLTGVSIVMVTGRHQVADKLAGLGAGVDDYITKPFEPAELSARVHGVLRRARELRDLSPLTGLPGNSQIHAAIERRIAACLPSAVLYVDLNQFKSYNDHYGFSAGDRILRATAGIVQAAVVERGGPDAFVGHIGGDDFIALVHPAVAMDVATRITTTFDQVASSYYSPADVERGHIEVLDRSGQLETFDIISVAVGIASTTGDTDATAEDLIVRASGAKHVAKATPASSIFVDRRARP